MLFQQILKSRKAESQVKLFQKQENFRTKHEFATLNSQLTFVLSALKQNEIDCIVRTRTYLKVHSSFGYCRLSEFIFRLI